jgi:hypothetical protein
MSREGEATRPVRRFTSRELLGALRVETVTQIQMNGWRLEWIEE